MAIGTQKPQGFALTSCRLHCCYPVHPTSFSKCPCNLPPVNRTKPMMLSQQLSQSEDVRLMTCFILFVELGVNPAPCGNEKPPSLLSVLTGYFTFAINNFCAICTNDSKLQNVVKLRSWTLKLLPCGMNFLKTGNTMGAVYIFFLNQAVLCLPCFAQSQRSHSSCCHA